MPAAVLPVKGYNETIVNMKYSKTLREIIVYAGIAVLFLVLAYAFVPEVLSGKVVNQSDTSAWKGMTHEISEHNAAHPDDKTLWTNSMFGGMPTVAMYDEFHGDWTNPLYKVLMTGARPANFLFISLIGGFLLMLVFGVNRFLAIAGAIAITFCSYNLQIIQVGHNTKMQAIAFMPWVLAGIVFTYRSALETYRKAGQAGMSGRKAASQIGTDAPDDGHIAADKSGTWKEWLPKTVLGAILFALALSFQIKANHPQITYYLAIIIFIYAITLFVWLCSDRDRRRLLGRFLITSVLLLVIGGTGICTNLNKLIPTYRYSEYTMRGGSELSPDSESHNDEGLDLDYATAWSYGIEETPNLLIPDFNGGASSGELKGRSSETYRLLQRAGQTGLDSIMKSLPLYWGPQPFTAGPMYMGAVTIFLFVLGLCLYRGKEKWWLLAATVIAILLAWGSHFMWFTKLWFEYAPMYNKFRTVSMALVLLQVTLPILGFIVLDRILKGDYNSEAVLSSTGIAFAVTAGFCFICILFPGLAGDFRGAADAQMPEMLSDALAADRRGLLVSDAWRSFILIALTVILLAYLFLSKKMSSSARGGIAAGVICLMVLFDLWGVGKRYLNSDHFISKRDFSGQFTPRTVDKMILEDTDPDYRVLDISVNTFNDAFPSYFHKCIGGYSPAKLQRYQDLIDRYISGEINSVISTVNEEQTISGTEENLPYLPVLSMLNGKYIIVGEDFPPVVNRHAFGNAWFVDKFVTARTPDEEIAMLGKVDLHDTAVIGNDFQWAQQSGVWSGNPDMKESIDDSEDYIRMTHYAPNELRYRYRAGSDRAVLFSEIYYPEGWTLTLYRDSSPDSAASGTDGASGISQEAGTARADIALFRADWILRGAILPAGEGELVMRFDPPSYRTGETLSRASSITLLILLLLSSGGLAIIGNRKKSL